MRYRIIDTHRYWTAGRVRELAGFLGEVKGFPGDAPELQTGFAERYRLDRTAICFEAVAYDGARIAGYMRCFNDPESRGRWFVGDIHVRDEYRRRGIATRLYSLVIDEVNSYEDSELIEASISRANTASIGLHKKLGFRDSSRSGSFADFVFEPDETFFSLELYKYCEIPPLPGVVKRIEPVWESIRRECAGGARPESRFLGLDMQELFDRGIAGDEFTVDSIWRGRKLVGLRLDDGDEVFEHIIGKAK